MVQLIDFAIMTVFAREFLEGSIIIGEYRTIILLGDSLQPGLRKEDALKEVTLSSLFAVLLALLVIAAVAIPLAVLSMSFDDTTSEIIEAVSKMVASVSLLLLSLKLPRFLGVYGKVQKMKKPKRRCRWTCLVASNGDTVEAEASSTGLSGESNGDSVVGVDDDTATGTSNTTNDGLTIRAIRFNVAWNIWREVAECGAFLIPFFLTGDGIVAVPLSGLIGALVGVLIGFGIYMANQFCKNRTGLAIFAVSLLIFLSAGMFTAASHILEEQLGSTSQVWSIPGDFWDANRLPMTIIKPFGYNSSRTILEMCCFWLWLALAGLLHYRQYRISPKLDSSCELAAASSSTSKEGRPSRRDSFLSSDDVDTAEIGEFSVEGSLTAVELSPDAPAACLPVVELEV